MKKALIILGIIFFSFAILTGNSFSEEICGIENCHGLEIKCGENVAEECTMLYAFGDRCRQYASCAVLDGECQFVHSEEFESCKSCVQKCREDYSEDVVQMFSCESWCGIDSSRSHLPPALYQTDSQATR